MYAVWALDKMLTFLSSSKTLASTVMGIVKKKE